MLTRLLIVLLLAISAGCATTRRQARSEARSEARACVGATVMSADVSEARLDGVEISVADTTVRIGRVTLTRSRADRADVAADTASASESASATESRPAAAVAPLLPWLLLAVALALLWKSR